jgi:5,6-dimethylbenzimidazole synthase
MLYPFSEEEKEAIYRVIRERRDVRRFIGGDISNDILDRILHAASRAPSVGFMQPWNFIIIRNIEKRKQVYESFFKANREAAQLFEREERANFYSQLKLEGILESSFNLLITCDRNRAGPVVLGRTIQPDMDLYSTVCAVQNLWLAARAEGVGVGWVSILDPKDLHTIFKIPETIVPIAYLCLGHAEEFKQEPELKTLGWQKEFDYRELIFQDEWAR